jgi:LysR family transcriptional regulator, nitrogen assimilation regulatory protein
VDIKQLKALVTVVETGSSAAPLSEPEVWRSIAIATPRAARPSPAARIVARELSVQVRAAATQGRWPSACIHEEQAAT